MYTREQQAENRKRWVEALRSGKYTQVRGRLKRQEGYCCLGVACEILLDELNLNWVECRDRPNFYELKGTRGFNSTSMPYEIRDAYGLVQGLALLTDERTLAGLNDNEGLSFKEIADVIESGLLVVQ